MIFFSLQGLVEEDTSASFNVPYYMPTGEEIQGVAGNEGSFEIEQLLTFALEDGDEEEDDDMWTKGEKIAKNISSFTEPVISHHFGVEILEQLFEKLTHIVVGEVAKEPIKVTSIAIVLKRGDGSSVLRRVEILISLSH